MYFQDFQCILNDSLEELEILLWFSLSRFPSASNSRKLPASFQRLQTEVSTAHYMELAEFSGRGLLFLNDHRVLLDLFCSCTRLSCLFLNMSQGFGYVDVKQPSFEKQKVTVEGLEAGKRHSQKVSLLSQIS